MPKIEQSITISAPVDRVFDIARNVEAFPQFMADLKSLVVKERSPDGKRTITEWVGIIREFKMTIKWTQEDLWDTALHRDDFNMLSGDMDSMSGYWLFTAQDAENTTFESVVNYEYNVPLIGAMVQNLIKKKMTENLQATMDAIKRRAEAKTA